MKKRTTTLVAIFAVIITLVAATTTVVIFEKTQKESLASMAQASLLTNTLEQSGYTQAYKVNYANNQWTVDGIKNGQPYAVVVNSTTGAIESETPTTVPVDIVPFPIAEITDLVYAGTQKYPDDYTYVATDKSGVYYVDTANHGDYVYDANTHEVYNPATHEVYNTGTHETYDAAAHETYDAAAHESAAYHHPAAADARVSDHARAYARRR